MARPYFILVAYEGERIAGNPWGIAFGAYDREDVVREREDYRDHGWKAKHLKVIRCADARPETCNAAIAALNAGE